MIGWLITIETVALITTLTLCRAARDADLLINKESRRAMPDGSRVDEANTDARESVADPSAHDRDPVPA